jgi:hypothetical protein
LKTKYDTIKSFPAVKFTCVYPLKFYFPATMNRKRYTAARASAARIATASALAGALTLAALAWTACAAASARWTDDATAKAAAALIHGESCTLGGIHHAPRAVRDAVWDKWTSRAVTAPRDRNPAASARVLDFARGYADTVDERDLMDASPSAVRAAVDSGRLD